MAVTLDTIRSLLLLLGPMLLPKAISWFRSIRTPSRSLPVQATPPRVRLALALILVLSATYLVKTLPPFAPENLFARTQSRLQIPVDVLFTRLAALRRDNALTEADAALRARFVNLESRLLYAQFGPHVLSDCPFCKADEPKTYFYYALPALLWPHLANLAAVAVLTSPSFTGSHGARWRTLATIASLAVAALDVYAVASYNHKANARALRLDDVHFFYWSLRNCRLLALAALDAVLGLVLYLSSTNRAFVRLPCTSERVEDVTKALLTVKSKLNAVGIINNTAMRDEELRKRCQAYWAHEGHLMREMMEEREVVESVNDALGHRINIDDIAKDAETYTDSVLEPLRQTQRNE
ncbi:uncharacterized protein MAM_04144 [Metarhizium album ARSEF 1941]|uniref:Chorismate synthase protein n=1 Tax=Metarhizium album (strain ARSEF 1941) TaxID=1081103 RepID=A0A0B2WY56_METAS|nr:uncharacterized protein MAM_04144 [Metarhizium album ARSEF 1941]KHN97755.1 hypothetical protein MAM_04144 [Metarhizium album ARSEF 1941]